MCVTVGAREEDRGSGRERGGREGESGEERDCWTSDKGTETERDILTMSRY